MGSGLSRDATKGIMMVVIFIVCAVGAILPYFFKNGKQGKIVLSLGTSFGGGIFVSAGLVHLLPDSKEELDALTTSLRFLPELLTIVGFLLIFFIEYIIIDHDAHEHLAGDGHKHKTLPDEQPGLMSASSSHSQDEPAPSAPQEAAYSEVTVIVLLLALSVHAFLEGFGLGCQTDVSQMTVYFIAITFHKMFETFSLSVSVMRSPLSFRKGIVVNSILVLMTPIGIGVGMLVILGVGDTSEAAAWVCAVANAISAGTFLYVSICEVIVGEFSKPFDPTNPVLSRKMKWGGFCSLLVGAAAMSALATVC